MDMELKTLVENIGKEAVAFRERYDKKLGDVSSQLEAIETAVARGNFRGGGGSGDGGFMSAASKEHKTAFLA